MTGNIMFKQRKLILKQYWKFENIEIDIENEWGGGDLEHNHHQYTNIHRYLQNSW